MGKTFVNSFKFGRVGDYLLITTGLSRSNGSSSQAGGGSTSSALPDTGQNTCYDNSGNVIACAGTGQDGEYSINPPSYTDNGDGTVTDNVTGLMWQQGEHATAYNWYEATGTPDGVFNPNGETDVCGSFTLAGYADWRLPTARELMRIADYGTYLPAIDITYFPNAYSSPYWTSNIALSVNGAWSVSFNGGEVDTDVRDSFREVRCVRGNATPAQSFTDNGDGTITDSATGLVWQQTDDEIVKTWQEALSYCKGLSLAGHVDWRLPNIKELESIHSYSIEYPAFNTTYFMNTMSSPSYYYFWASTSHYGVETNAIGINFNYGGQFSNDKSISVFSNSFARCVRGGN
jgi:hypothetical protein